MMSGRRGNKLLICAVALVINGEENSSPSVVNKNIWASEQVAAVTKIIPSGEINPSAAIRKRRRNIIKRSARTQMLRSRVDENAIIILRLTQSPSDESKKNWP